MATDVPAKLKTADLTRFIVRALQLEIAKPVIAYWCKSSLLIFKTGINIYRRILDRQSDPIEEPS